MTAKPVRVLIVDDDEDDFLLTRGLLSQVPHGSYAVEWAESYEEGLERIERSEHDVYLVDYRLGRENGLELLRQAKAIGRGAPMILLTGQGDYEVDTMALAAGAEAYLDKGRLGSTELDRSIRYAITRNRVEQERQELDVQIQHLQRLESLGVMAAGVAHDFNNLLAGILGYADLALSEVASGSSVHEMIEGIKRTAHNASDLTSQLLTYTGRNQPLMQPVNLSRLVDEMRSLISAVVAKSAKLSFELAPNLPDVEAAHHQVRQLVMNLITNASEALGGRSGDIQVSTSVRRCDRAYPGSGVVIGDPHEGRYVCLAVADSGCGMDAETQARMFDPFYTTKFTGRGLGLASVLGIVRSHGGVICVDSTPGRGTRFEVLLPCPTVSTASGDQSHRNVIEEVGEVGGAAQEAGGEQPGVHELPGQRNGVRAGSPSQGDRVDPSSLRRDRTVLVVDDDRVVREVVAMAVEKMGYRVLKAGDGQEAIDLFRRHAPDIAAVVLDVTMPVVSGKEALVAILAERAETPIVLCSGFGEKDVMDGAGEVENVCFLQKPYLPRDLAAKIDEMINRRQGS